MDYVDVIDVLAAVHQERERQDEVWGEQNHDPALWLSILTEEVGEVAKEVQEMVLGPRLNNNVEGRYRTELVQVAAVAVAAIESLDRGWRAA